MTTLRVHIQARGSLATVAPGTRTPVLPPRPNWHDRAACDGHDELNFFPDAGEALAAEALKNLYCRTCPVWATCLSGALARKDYGIWAGTTTQERNKLIRSRDRAKCPLCRCETLITIDTHDICHGCGVSWRTENRPPEQDASDDQ